MLYSACRALPCFSQSFTISQEQIQALSTNLSTLKSLTLQLRQNLNSYKQTLQLTMNELQASQSDLTAARNECGVSEKIAKSATDVDRAVAIIEDCETIIEASRRRDSIKNVLFVTLLALSLAK